MAKNPWISESSPTLPARDCRSLLGLNLPKALKIAALAQERAACIPQGIYHPVGSLGMRPTVLPVHANSCRERVHHRQKGHDFLPRVEMTVPRTIAWCFCCKTSRRDSMAFYSPHRPHPPRHVIAYLCQCGAHAVIYLMYGRWS